MKRSHARWLSAFAASVLAAGGAGGAEAWRVSEQPGLKDALEGAALLRTESLGEPARGVNVWERWMVPNPDGKTWDVLQIYFKEYYGPTWLHAIDLGTGEVKKQRLPDGHQFYLSGRARGPDGFLWTYLRDVLVRVDPGDASVHVVGKLERPGRPTFVGDDLYLSGTEALRRIRAIARTQWPGAPMPKRTKNGGSREKAR